MLINATKEWMFNQIDIESEYNGINIDEQWSILTKIDSFWLTQIGH